MSLLIHPAAGKASKHHLPLMLKSQFRNKMHSMRALHGIKASDIIRVTKLTIFGHKSNLLDLNGVLMLEICETIAIAGAHCSVIPGPGQFPPWLSTSPKIAIQTR